MTYDISKPLEWAWKWIKIIGVILTIVIILLGYSNYKTYKRGQLAIEGLKKCEEAMATTVVETKDNINQTLANISDISIPLYIRESMESVFVKLDIDINEKDLIDLKNIPDNKKVFVELKNGDRIVIGYFNELGLFKTTLK